MNDFLPLGMLSHFLNFIFKTTQYHQIKVLNNRIPEWAHLTLYHYRFSRYVHLKFQNQGNFSAKFPLMKFQKVGTKSLISEFSELVFK